MNVTLLEYIKIILEKVSFDATLFEKELKKYLKLLLPQEVKALRKWCYVQFGKTYRSILRSVFPTRLKPILIPNS
jgi:hypothetical protein